MYNCFSKSLFSKSAFSIFVTLYFRIDALMIAYFLDNINLGIYSAALTLVGGFYFLPGVLANAYFPRLSNYFKNDKERLKALFNIFLIKITLLVVPTVLTLYFISNYLIILLYGVEFIDSVAVFELDI